MPTSFASHLRRSGGLSRRAAHPLPKRLRHPPNIQSRGLAWRALSLPLWVGCTAGPRQHAVDAATTSAQIQEATQWCDFRSPLGCCRSEHFYTWDWVPRSGEASGGAWTAQGGYAMACRFAPKGYKSARGCLNYVAIAPLAAMDVDALNPTLTRPDPPTDASRLQILRDTLEALRLGRIDE